MENVLIMFYSHSDPQILPQLGVDGQVGDIPLHRLQAQNYYQIYEDGRPLGGMAFSTLKAARRRLRGLVEELQQASNGWYEVTSRLPTYLPVRNILGVRKTYGDGSSVNVTYVIQKVMLRASTAG